MCCARRGGPRTQSPTTAANLDCAFVENALSYTVPSFVKSQQNRIELVTRPVASFCFDHFFPLLISSYVDARQYHLEDSRLYAVTSGGRGGSYDEESPCGDRCPCQKLQYRAKNDPYIFSLATNPFYLWLICTVIKS